MPNLYACIIPLFRHFAERSELDRIEDKNHHLPLFVYQVNGMEKKNRINGR